MSASLVQAPATARRALLMAGLLALSLAASAVLAPRASAMGQPAVGFAEVSLPSVEQFQVMGKDWAVRSNLTFQHGETVRVNVTSTLVDVAGNGGGAGTETLAMDDFHGVPIGATEVFTEHTGTGAFVYNATLNFSVRVFEPDWYYLRIGVNDTVHSFRATVPIQVGTPLLPPHSIQTYADPLFQHPSDVFTSTSTVWVKVVGSPGGGGSAWDLEQYVDHASVVGGPVTDFTDFTSRSGVYTFSIDLSAYSGLAPGWAYTLPVILTNGAFDGGAQVWIYDPTVGVTSTSLAPAQALQGAAGVSMLETALTLNGPFGGPWGAALGPASFSLDRLQITRTGTGTGADVSGVHVWLDANGNGIVDAGDVQIASVQDAAGLTFPLWIGNGDITAVNSSASLHLLLTVDIAPSATVGDTVGLEIATATDVDMPYSVTVTGTPLASSNVTIAGATVLTVTDRPGIAPGSVAQGQANVPVDLLHMASNGGSLTVTQVDVSLQGSGTPADIASVSLHVDNGDGVYSPSTDPRLGAATTFPASGPAVFGGLNFAVDSVGQSVWVVFNISAGAPVGETVGSLLTSNASVLVASGSVYNGTFPLASGLVTIGGNTLTVTWKSLAPALVVQGAQNVTMVSLALSVDFGTVHVTGIRVDRRGNGTDADVSRVKLWLDANKDGIFDSGDLLQGQGSFVAGTTTITGFNVSVAANNPVTLFVTFDIAPAATTGVTVGARLAGPAYLSVGPSTTVSGLNFPVLSQLSTIVAPGSGALLTVQSVDMARWTAYAYLGQPGVPMEKLYLSVNQNSGTVTGLHVERTGTATTDGAVAEAHLWLDADRSGNLSAGDTLLGSAAFVAGVAAFGGLNLPVSFNQPVTLFLTFDLGTSAAQVGKTVGLSLATSAYVVGNATTTVDPNSFPIASSNVTIAAASLSGTVRDGSGNGIAGATVRLPQLNLTATADANGHYSFSGLPLGSYYALASASGYDSSNKTVNLTTSNPNPVLDLVLTASSNGLAFGATLWIGLIAAAVVAVLAAMAFLLVRRRSTCPVCGKPKPKEKEVCPECEAKGLKPGGNPPAPPTG